MSENIQCTICKKEITDGKFVYVKYNGVNKEVCDHHPRPDKKENDE